MPCVVQVEDVELGDKNKFRARGLRNDHFLQALVNRDNSVTKTKDNTVTAHSPQGEGYKYRKVAHMAGRNPFVSAVHLAFAEHLPLRISPDLIFLIIIQGMSAHIAQDPESHRAALVFHEGTQELMFIKPTGGPAQADWGAAVASFASTIAASVPSEAIKAMMQTKFSTTGPNRSCCA